MDICLGPWWPATAGDGLSRGGLATAWTPWQKAMACRHLMVSQCGGAGQESLVVLSKASHAVLLGEGKLSLCPDVYPLCVGLVCNFKR